jgi:hypothetical protein
MLKTSYNLNLGQLLFKLCLSWKDIYDIRN